MDPIESSIRGVIREGGEMATRCILGDRTVTEISRASGIPLRITVTYRITEVECELTKEAYDP